MRNLRKLSAVVLAAALVLTSVTAVFAADATDAATAANADKAATLKDLGLYSGQDANDPRVGLEDALTTQDSLIFLAKLFGYFETASALADDKVAEDLAKFDDAASISEYAKNVVAYSAANGILSGMTDGKKIFVGAKDTVTAARFATFMLKQMGYSVADYKASVASLAQTHGSKVDATITGDLTRDDAVGVMYGALTAEKATGKTVIADIIGDNADLKAKAEKLGLIDPPEITEVAVESVKALNCKQIEIVFNQEMDRNSAESEHNYEIYDYCSSIAVTLGDNSASLSDDRKTVTITLNKNIKDKLTNSSEAKVIVKNGIIAASESSLVEDAVFEKVVVEDGLIPTVTKAEAIGEQLIKITFSEPVYDKDNDNSIDIENFKVESGTYQYYVQEATLNNNVITLVLGTKLIEGPIDVTVNNAGADKTFAIVDYAGYAVFKGTTKFDYVKDTSVSVVTVKSASPNKVVLGFTKPVKATNVKLYHSVKNAANYGATATTADYVDEITFTYDTENNRGLPSGEVKLFLVNSTEDRAYMLVDGYGVKVPDQTLTATVVIDETPPEFKSGKFDKNVSITLTFDEELDKEVAGNTGNYEIRNTKDNSVTAFSIKLDNSRHDTRKQVTLLPNPKLNDNTEYQVLIKKTRDIKGNETKEGAKPFTYTFTTGDNEPPEIIRPLCYAKAEDGKITIVYSEPMNESQMLDKNNYMVSFNGESGSYKSLGDADSITKESDCIVTIYFKELDNKNDPTIRPYVKIAPIMDLAGKRLYGKVDAQTVESIGRRSADVTVESAKENKVVLGFSKPVKGSKIRLNVGSYNATASTTDYINEITFTFNQSLPNGRITLHLVNSEAENEKIVDRDGIKVPDQTLSFVVEAPPAPPTPSDTTPPVVVGECMVKGIESITITFNERLNRTTAIDPASYEVTRLSDNQEINFTPELDTSKKSVKLIFDPVLDNDTEYQLLIRKCKDTSGNIKAAYNYEINFWTRLPDIAQATLTARNQITVLFNTKMASIDKDDFIVSSTTPGAINVISCEQAAENSNEITEVVLNLDKDIATDAKDEDGNVIYIETVADPTSESDSGVKLKGQSSHELNDSIAPEVVMWDHDNDEETAEIAKVMVSGQIADPQYYDHDNRTITTGFSGTITIYFSEDIEESTLNEEHTFQVVGYVVDEITAPAGTKTVVLKVTVSVAVASITPTVIHFSDIHDTAGNTLSPGPSWESTLDHMTT